MSKKQIHSWHILQQVKGEDKTRARSPTIASQPVTWNYPSGTDFPPCVSVWSLGREAGTSRSLRCHILLRPLSGRCALKCNEKLHLQSVSGLGQHPRLTENQHPEKRVRRYVRGLQIRNSTSCQYFLFLWITAVRCRLRYKTRINILICLLVA